MNENTTFEEGMIDIDLAEDKTILDRELSRRSALKLTAASAAVIGASTLFPTSVFAGSSSYSTAKNWTTGALKYDRSKCKMCGDCVDACEDQGIRAIVKDKKKDMIVMNASKCIGCGQCTLECDKKALVEADHLTAVKNAISAGKTIVWQFAPTTQHSVGDFFDLDEGYNVSLKLPTAVKKLSSKSIAYRTDCAADLTIMEEATELVERITNKGTLPLITSCCPGWINYAESRHPELLNTNISSCKSPMEMLAALIKRKHPGCFHVAVMPCTAKKIEAKRSNMSGNVDASLTVREFASLLKSKSISLKSVSNGAYDTLFDDYTGAARLFGCSGGVMEAALRTAYYMITGKNMTNLTLTALRSYKTGIKTASINMGGKTYNVAVVNGIKNIETVLRNKSNYAMIEVMACPAGCAGGGGNKDEDDRDDRVKAMQSVDAKSTQRYSYQNKDVIEIYKELGKPGSDLAKSLLHVKY